MAAEFMAAMRCSSGPARVDGSERGKCSQCGDAVWLSPASLAFVAAKPGVKIVCFEPCAMLLGTVEPKILPGSVEEFRAWAQAQREAKEN